MTKYQLEERILNFNANLIIKLKCIPPNIFNIKLMEQLFRSATSIGANYAEANGAESRRDFIHKIRISYKEARETRYWLALLPKIEEGNLHLINELWQEADEYIKKFSKIITTTKKNEHQKV